MAHQDMAIAQFYVNKITNAESRGIPFDLSFTSFKNMAKANKCYFTGLPLEHNTFTIDRIDNKKGYVKGNVVACHKAFNQIKSLMENPNNDLDIKTVTRGFIKTKKRMGEGK